MAIQAVIAVELRAEQATRGTRGLDEGLRRAQRSAFNLRRALQAVVGAAIIRQVFRFADSVQALNQRIRIVTDSQQEFVRVQGQVNAIANQTFQSISSTVTVFQRLNLAAEDLGISQGTALDVTEALGNAVRVSGATAVEARGALIQLSQAIASNRFGGEELRSVAEQLPVVFRAIAKNAGVTTGELRTLAAAGEITGRDLIEAIQAAAPVWAEMSEKIAPRLGEALTLLGNSIVQLGQRVDESGAFQAIAVGIERVANTLNQFTAAGIEGDLVRLQADLGTLLRLQFQAAREQGAGANQLIETLRPRIQSTRAQIAALEDALRRLRNNSNQTEEQIKETEEAADAARKRQEELASDPFDPTIRITQRNIEAVKRLREREKEEQKRLDEERKRGAQGVQDFFDELFEEQEEQVIAAFQLRAELDAEITENAEKELKKQQKLQERTAMAVADAWTDAGDVILDTIEELVKTGKVDLENLIRLALDAAIQIQAARTGGPAQTPGRLVGGFLSSALGALGGLFGFQEGGSFTVPGTGGADSQVVAFKGTPGERVTVSPEGGGVTLIQNFSVATSDGNLSSRTQQQIGAAAFEGAQRAFRNNR